MLNLRETLDAYRRGLEAEVPLLESLARTASDQFEASLNGDAVTLAACAARRESLMESLLVAETDLQRLRALVAANLPSAEPLEGFDAVQRLHRIAEHWIDEVQGHDIRTRAQLQQRELTRRAAAHTLDTGEATLAAYRKTLSPTAVRSSIVDRLG
jgi:hypothetical protein